MFLVTIERRKYRKFCCEDGEGKVRNFLHKEGTWIHVILVLEMGMRHEKVFPTGMRREIKVFDLIYPVVISNKKTYIYSIIIILIVQKYKKRRK